MNRIILLAALGTLFFVPAFFVPANAKAESVFRPFNSNSSSSGSLNTLSSTTGINITAPLDFTGPVTFSIPIVSGRSESRVFSQLEKIRSSTTKNYCASITPAGKQTYTYNGRIRKFRLFGELDHMDVSVSRVSEDNYSGTANITIRCILN